MTKFSSTQEYERAVDTAVHTSNTEQLGVLLTHKKYARQLSPLVLHVALRQHNIQCALMLVPIIDLSHDSGTSLCLAAKWGRTECVQALIPHTQRPDHHTALTTAAAHGHTKCVQLLLPLAEDAARNKALQKAAENGHLVCCRAIIPHCDPKADDSAALSVAARAGHKGCVRLLLPHSTPQDVSGDALCWAAERGHTDIVKMLVAASAHPPISGLWGAIRFGHMDIVHMLLPLCDPKHKDSKALQFAICGPNPQCIDVLWPLSDVVVAVRKTKKMVPPTHRARWQELERRAGAEQQRAAITDAVSNTPPPSHARLRKL